MAWRLANGLVTLRDETRAVAPGTRVDTIGDQAHAATWSDHNPNECCDVVCASDTFDNAGLDLDWFAARIVATNPPALKYVIWRDQIWFPGLGWQPYFGQYHSHVHTSVGWGPDGRSTGPYDDTSPWGVLSTEEDVMGFFTEIGPNGEQWGDARQKTTFFRVDALHRNLPAVAEGQTKGEPNGLYLALKELGERIERIETGGIDYAKLADAVADKLRDRLQS